MFEIFVGVIFGMVLVIVEIQYRHVKKKLERLEGLCFQVYDAGEDRVVVDHSLKMLVELSRFGRLEYLYKGLIIKVYVKGEGG